MSRYLVIFSLFVAHFGYSQSSVDEMVDSLSFTKNTREKIELSQRIAYQLKNSDWDRALSYLDLAKGEAIKLKEPDKLLADVYVTAARMYDSKDVLDVTLEYYLKANEIYKALNDTAQVVKLENNLAIVFARLNNKEKALLYFRRVYAYQLQKKDSLHLSQILNNIGTLFLENKPDSSLYYYRQSLPIVEAIGDSLVSAYLYTNMARAYAKTGVSGSDAYFDRALKFLRGVKERSAKSFVYGSVAHYYLNAQMYDSSIFYANKALILLEENPFNFTSEDAVNTLYRAYLSKEDYRSATNYFDQYNAIRDSLNVVDKAVNVERLKLQQDYKTRAEIRALSEERERYKYYFVGFGLLAGILILSLIVFRFRNRIIKNNLEKDLLQSKQKELRHDLEVKNQVMVSKAMAGMQQADAINGVVSDLKALRLEMQKKSSQHSIDKIISRLKRDLNDDIWQEFEISFEQVHNSFYTNLNAKHPDLTPKDRRLCSLLYLDLSSKEISQITGQSFKSIENARTRLRKKLDLTNEKINISSYLIELE